jgi:hypothetical protein
VSALLLDAGALLSADRGERETMLRLRRAQQDGLALRSSGMVVAQVWRDRDGQANLARLLQAVDVRALDERLGREAGELLGRTGGVDPVEASVVATAADGDRILTSEPDAVHPLVAATGRSILVVPC